MHLLLCTDGSPQSEAALALGARLASCLAARVTLLGALDEPDREAQLTTFLDERNAALKEIGVLSEGVILPTFLRCAVTAQAAAEPYDMVVVGDQERGWFRRWLRGPSTRRILRDVSSPVLVVPADRRHIKRILMCSGDLWYPAELLAWVQRIAIACAAEVSLIYVVPQPQLSYPLLRDVEDAWGALLQTDTPQGRHLNACRGALLQAGVEIGVKLRHGPVIEQILAEVLEGEYDLIALGSTYAGRGLRRYFAPSVTDALVERAGRPALVVRHHGEILER